tara:strand:- start:3134 stop:4831 length:1698 start_codon:yes stop_codon:yes gene_type:complete
MAVFRHTVNVDTGASPANLRELEERSDQLERSLRSVESRAGRVGSASTKLAGVLGRVSPALGESAMVVNDLADGFEVAAIAGPRLLAVLGPIGAAAGVAAGAYFILKSRLDEATAAMEESARQAETMARINMEVRDTALMAALAQGEITEEEFNRIIAARDAETLFGAQKANQQERIEMLKEERTVLEAAIESNKALLEASSQGGGTTGGILAGGFTAAEESENFQNRLEQLNEELRKNESLTNAAERSLEILDGGQSRHASNLEIIANSTSAATSATQQYTASIHEATEATEQLLFTTQEGLTSEEALFQNATAAIQAARGEISLDELRRINGTADMVRQAQAMQAVDFAAIQGGIAQGLGTIANPASALGLLGPAGAVIGGLAAIGEAGGAAGVEARLDDLLDNVTDGIEALPDILVNVIPPFVQALVTELPGAIAAALVGVFAELIDKVFPNRDVNEERRERLIDILAIGQSTIFGPLGVGLSVSRFVRNESDRREAASRGRMARADGARRLAMSRAPTAQIMGSPSLTINALGIDDGTQDQFQRRFARYTDPNTGLRGRDG